MAEVNAIYADLCSAMEVAQEVDAAVIEPADGALINPILVGVLGRWVADKVRELTCQNSPQILEAAEQWLTKFVKNQQAVQILLQVAELAIGIVCSDQPQ